MEEISIFHQIWYLVPVLADHHAEVPRVGEPGERQVELLLREGLRQQDQGGVQGALQVQPDERLHNLINHDIMIL